MPTNPRSLVSELAAGAWGLSALGVAAERGLLARLASETSAVELAADAEMPEELAAALLDVLVALGVARRSGERYVGEPEFVEAASRVTFAADVRSTLLQSSELVAAARGDGPLAVGWRVTDPEVLEAQGVMSAAGVDVLQRVVFPSVDGMEERLGARGAAFLDVGAGVAAVSIEMCRRYPEVRAVGLEPAEAPLALARRNVQAAGLEDRIELRRQLVQEMDDEEAFDVAWLPGNFLHRSVLQTALPVLLRALRPGGLLLYGTLGGGGDDVRAATGRLKAILWGGDALPPERAVEMLEHAGFTHVFVGPRLPTGLAPMHARRPG